MRMIFAAVVLLLAVCQCQGLDKDANADLRVPPSISEGPEITIRGAETHQMFKIDDTVKFSCVASGVPDPEYEWYRDGSLMDLNTHVNIDLDPEQPGTGSIVIKPAYGLDEGYYQCRVENEHGIAMSQVVFLQRARLDPSTSGNAKEYPVTEGQPLKLPCNTGISIPIPKYSWSTAETTDATGQTDIVFNKRVNIDEEGNLYFSYVVPEDAKSGFVYKCNVFNNILDIQSGGSYAKIQVFNNPAAPNLLPENMYHTPSDVIAIKGKEQRLKCLFQGKPEVTISWGRDTSVGLPPYHKVQSSTTELVIYPVALDDEAVYTCTGNNQLGSTRQNINMKVEAEPEFEKVTDKPRDTNFTQGETAEIRCWAFAIPDANVQWFINGQRFEDVSPGSRYKVSDDGKTLTIKDVCKDCDDGKSDIQNIQCNASNVHGYAYDGGYVNILLPTVIAEGPVNTEMEYGEGTNITLDCSATSDDSTPISYRWRVKQRDVVRDVDYKDDVIWMREDNSLIIQAKDEDTAKDYVGTYYCVATNGYSTVNASAIVSLEGYVAPVVQSGFALWWIFIIIAVILLLLILLLCCCLCCQRNRGDAYPVDEKERKQGLDPEKELADSGFQDYQRPEDEPMKGSRASLTSTIKLDSDDEGSLAEYGDLDTGKFNEDGSFIGQYTTDKKKRPPTESNV